MFADLAFGRVRNAFPRCFVGLDPDRFVEDGWLGCGDDHIPIIDCMKIFCREGKKEEGMK